MSCEPKWKKNNVSRSRFRRGEAQETVAGNRYDNPVFIVEDIFKTHDDGLAKIIRKKLKERNIKAHTVVYSYSKPIKINKVIGSISYYPVACACTLASYLVNFIIKEKKDERD